MSIESKKTQDLNILNYEPGHHLEDITHARGEAMSLKLTGTFNVCKACTLIKAKKDGGKQLSCSVFKN